MDSVTTSIKKKEIRRFKKCEKHPFMYLDLLNLDPTTNQHRVCTLCVQEQNILLEKVISISFLLNSDCSTLLPLFPIDQNLINLTFCSINFEAISKEIDDYFTQLSDNLQKAVYKKLDEEKIKVQSALDKWKESKIQIENISSIIELQELLKEEELGDKNDSENLLHINIVKRSEDAQKILLNIKQSTSQVDLIQSCFSSENPLETQKQIISLINSVDFYKTQIKASAFPWKIISQKWQYTQFVCTPSNNLDNSKKDLLIEKNIITNQANNWRQCYLSKQLERDKKYQIQLFLNNQYKGSPKFKFGLINSQDKDTKWMQDSDGIFYSEHDGGNTTKIVKGQKLYSQNKSNIGIKSLEFRIDINSKFWRVSEFPDYLNVAELNDPNKFDNSKEYFLAIQIDNQLDQVKIIKVNEMEIFDNFM